MEAMTLNSANHLRMCERSNPYNIGSYVYDSNGEVYTIDEAIDLWQELTDEGQELFYGVNWEYEIWSSSGIQIPSVYAEF